MALTVNFTTTQPSGEPSQITFTDTSTGTDATITQRRIYVRTYDGTALVEDGTSTEYEVWSGFPATTTITLDLLDKDYGVSIVVQWLTAGGTVVYDKTVDATGFTSYNEDFDYSLTQLLTANPDLADDNGFREHKSDLRNFIDSGDQAIERASELYSAQRCYDLATNLRLDSQYYFNADE